MTLIFCCRQTLSCKNDYGCLSDALSVLAIREHGTLAKPLHTLPNHLTDTAQSPSQRRARGAWTGRESEKTPLTAF